MADRELVNKTPFAAKELYVADEAGRDLLVVVVRAAYQLGRGVLTELAEEAAPIVPAGVYNGEPGESSVRFEPDVTPLKLATDVVMLGHANAPHTGTRVMDVALQVGSLQKIVRVFGDRWWSRRAGVVVATEPQPFEKMPLIYERAFGGWDRTSDNPADHTVEPRNPVGVGYHHPKRSQFVDGQALPNLQLPNQLLSDYEGSVTPAGFGFVGHDWVPRRHLAGTYDEAWVQDRMPLLPHDFDQRFYNGAPHDQIVAGYLRGAEPVRVFNALPEGTLEFGLPGEPPPQCSVVFSTGKTEVASPPLDTVAIDLDARRVILTWRARFAIRDSFFAIRAIRVDLHAASPLARRHALAAAS